MTHRRLPRNPAQHRAWTAKQMAPTKLAQDIAQALRVAHAHGQDRPISFYTGHNVELAELVRIQLERGA